LPEDLPESIVVAAAVARRGDTVLVTRRLEGTHLAGLWEFPGGKCEPGESHVECLARELHEELGVAVRIGRLLLSTRHDYGVKIVELHFFDCAIDAEPSPRLGQEIRWVARHDLGALEFPPADAELIASLVNGETQKDRRAEGQK
jgi:8-oxo-dGTP diphosphatase